MKRLLILVGFASILVLSGSAQPKKVFAYPVNKVTLENGLDLIVIEMPEFKDVLSFNMLVLAGARNETEKGKTGFAHLFEHIMFRHKYEGELNGYDKAMDRMGAFNNAWTWFDVTFYHPLTFAFNLDSQSLPGGEKRPGLLELEASRFASLAFDKKIFQTESGAVLGEYRKSATDPGLAIDEKMLELAFPKHSYGHTTIGTYQDVVDMPNQYDYAVWFYDTYYRPNNCVLVVSGDVKKDNILPKIRNVFGKWKPKPTPDVTVQDPPQAGVNRGHVDWDADVPPRVHVAYKLPAYKTGSVETAVGQVLPELLVSESAPMYKSLRYDKKTVSRLYFSGGTATYEGFDARLVNCAARLYPDQYKAEGTSYLGEVEKDIVTGFEALKSFSESTGAAEILETIKSKYKYDFLAAMDSPANVAQTFALYYRFERDPDVLNKLIQSVENLKPADIDAFAARYFVDTNRTVVTMAGKGGSGQ